MTQVLTQPPDGAWTQVIEPRAIHRQGVTYLGWVQAGTGNIMIGAYDHTDQSFSTAQVGVAPGPLVVDTHNAPVIEILPDQRIIVVWAGHGSTEVRVRVSTNPLDITSWDPYYDIDPMLGGGLYTYPTLLWLGTDLYLFIRDWIGPRGYACYAKSSDNGVNWTGRTILARPTFDQTATYWTASSDGNRIDVAISTGNGASEPGVTVHHIYFDGTAWYGANGCPLGLPIFNVSSLPVVYDGADGSGWPSGTISDGPMFMYIVDKFDGMQSFRTARWNGTTWDHDTISEAPWTEVLQPSVAIESPTVTYAPVWDGSDYRMHRYESGQATDIGHQDDYYPARIHGHPGAVWLHGSFVTQHDWSFGTVIYDPGFTPPPPPPPPDPDPPPTNGGSGFYQRPLIDEDANIITDGDGGEAVVALSET
jgi:hypothetical protein